MSKWVNFYLIALIINIVFTIFFSASIVFSSILFVLGSIVLFLSRENKTTSIVHIIMFLIGAGFLSFSVWRLIYG